MENAQAFFALPARTNGSHCFFDETVYRWESRELTQGGNLADIYGKTPTTLMNAMLIT